MRRPFAVVALAVFVTAGQAFADRLWIGRLGAQDVTVRGVEGGNMVYFANGRERQTPLDEIARIEVEGQQALNAAEEAFQGGDWKVAAEQYDRLLTRRNADAWVERRATFRLVESAAKAGLFPQAAAGYVSLIALDPEQAVGRQPDAGAADVSPAELNAARERVRSGLSSAGSDAARRQLLSFLLQLDNASGDEKAAANTIEQLGKLIGEGVPAERADWPTYATITLGRANLAINSGDAAAAAKLINEASATFVTPALSGQALFLLAKAAEAEAGDDRSKLLDAALAYLKVATFATETPKFASDGLLAAGDIHRKLGLADDAADLYRATIAQYPDSTAAGEAQQRLTE